MYAILYLYLSAERGDIMTKLQDILSKEEYTVYYVRKRGVVVMTNLQDILSKEEYTVYTAYCVQGRKLLEIVDDTGLSINQVLNRIKTARRKIIAACNLKGVEK